MPHAHDGAQPVGQSGGVLSIEPDAVLAHLVAADVRLDDPTVSRRHALIVRHPQGVRLLDDRSLNGVFVNEARVESRILHDGDEIIIGRYRLTLIGVAPDRGEQVRTADSGSLPEPD